MKGQSAMERGFPQVGRPTHFTTELEEEGVKWRIAILSAGGRVPMQGSFSSSFAHDPERTLNFLRTHKSILEFGSKVTYTKLLYPHVHNIESDADKWKDLALAIEEQYNKVRNSGLIETLYLFVVLHTLKFKYYIQAIYAPCVNILTLSLSSSTILS